MYWRCAARILIYPSTFYRFPSFGSIVFGMFLDKLLSGFPVNGFGLRSARSVYRSPFVQIFAKYEIRIVISFFPGFFYNRSMVVDFNYWKSWSKNAI